MTKVKAPRKPLRRNEHGAVIPLKARDSADFEAIARGFLKLERCAGSRVVVQGYVCAHCGIDRGQPQNAGFCGQPVDEDGVTLFNSAVARRIIMEGETT